MSGCPTSAGGDSCRHAVHLADIFDKLYCQLAACCSSFRPKAAACTGLCCAAAHGEAGAEQSPGRLAERRSPTAAHTVCALLSCHTPVPRCPLLVIPCLLEQMLHRVSACDLQCAVHA